MALQIGGGIFGATQGQAQQNAMANYYDYQAKQIATQSAMASDAVERQGGIQSSQADAKGRQVIASQRVAMAANGLASDSYTYQNNIDDTVAKSKLDSLAIQYNADMNSWNIQNNAGQQIAGLNSAASNARAAGKSALIGGLLSTAGQFSDTWSKWQQTSAGATQTTPIPTYRSTQTNHSWQDSW